MSRPPHSPVWMRPELLSPMLKNCSMSGRTPGKKKDLRMSTERRPHPGELLPCPCPFFQMAVHTSHGEAVHVVQEVDVTQHSHYEGRMALRQTSDALQALAVRDLGLPGLRIPHGPWHSRVARRWPIIWVISLAEERRRVGPCHGSRRMQPPTLRSHLRRKKVGERTARRVAHSRLGECSDAQSKTVESPGLRHSLWSR